MTKKIFHPLLAGRQDGSMPKKGDTSTNVTVLSRHLTRHEKRLLPSSCLSVHQHVSAYSRWTDFRELWFYEESIQKLPNFVKIWQKMTATLHENLITYIVDGSTEYSVARQQCRVKSLLHFHGNTEHFYIVDSQM
jgi:hypothetical protein